MEQALGICQHEKRSNDLQTRNFGILSISLPVLEKEQLKNCINFNVSQNIHIPLSTTIANYSNLRAVLTLHRSSGKQKMVKVKFGDRPDSSSTDSDLWLELSYNFCWVIL